MFSDVSDEAEKLRFILFLLNLPLNLHTQLHILEQEALIASPA